MVRCRDLHPKNWHRVLGSNVFGTTGPSDLNAIRGIITDFLHKPYNSIEDPLDLWFHDLPVGSESQPFTVGYSVRMGKSMAAIGIWLSVVKLVGNNELSIEELGCLAKELSALTCVKAMTDPGSNMEEQVAKSISKKFRVTDRPRPHPMQQYTAFSKVMSLKRATGDKRPDTQVLASIIKEFNQSQSAKNRVTTEERAILILRAQSANFKNTLAKHWQHFPVPFSAVPVSLLCKPWLGDSYEPAVKKSQSPRMHAALLGSKEKRDGWLDRVIGKYLKGIRDMKAAGKSINIKSVGPSLRKEPDEELVRHCACLFISWVPAFRAILSPTAMDELVERFKRGALDRELIEKIKSADESVGVHDWRFLAVLADYRPPAQEVGQVEDAQRDKLNADFKYDMLMWKKEQKLWSNCLTQMRVFNAETHNAQLEEKEARFV